jgi:hypothetical protein
MTPDIDAPQEANSVPAVGSNGETPSRSDGAANGPALKPDEIPLENLLDQNLDETNVEDALRSRITISTLASMASLDVVIPGGGMLAGLYDTLFRSREMNDDFSISNLGGTLDEYFLEKMGVVDSNGQKIDDDDKDGWDAYIEAGQERIERQEREEQEREEWAQSESSFAGVEMTGEEWGQLAKDIAPNGKLHQSLIDYYMKKGKTQAQAEQKASDDEAIYNIQAKPPSQRTDEEKHKIGQANADPEFRAATSFLNNERMQGVTPVNSLEQTSTSAKFDVSVSMGADAFDGDSIAIPQLKASDISAPLRSSGSNDFPSAPDLTEHHQAAVAATVPLDRPKPSLTVAATAPAPGGGFDV